MKVLKHPSTKEEHKPKSMLKWFNILRNKKRVKWYAIVITVTVQLQGQLFIYSLYLNNWSFDVTSANFRWEC